MLEDFEKVHEDYTITTTIVLSHISETQLGGGSYTFLLAAVAHFDHHRQYACDTTYTCIEGSHIHV